MTRSHLLVLLSIASNGCGGRAQTIADEPTGGPSMGGSSAGGPGAVAGDTSSHAAAGSGGTSSSGTAGDASIATGGAPPLDPRACVEELNSGVLQGACDNSCYAKSDCCFGSVSCDSGAQLVSTSCQPSGFSTTCSVDAPTSTLSGDTPFGMSSFSYAWPMLGVGFAPGLTLFFTHSSLARTCEAESLGFSLEPPYVGTHTVPVALNVNGRYTFGTGSVDILQSDFSGTSGTLEIAGTGWHFSGQFSAPDCPALDDFSGK